MLYKNIKNTKYKSEIINKMINTYTHKYTDNAKCWQLVCLCYTCNKI